MKVMVVGSGGREHALAWKLSQSPKCEKLFLTPGNDGAALEPHLQRKPIAVDDHDGILSFVKKESIDLVVIGPDQALADGLTDKLHGVLVYGPSQAAARLETSKSFAKQVMETVHIPTARFAVFDKAKEAIQFLKNSPWKSGWALKADGLALGKGVVVTQCLDSAIKCVESFMIHETMGSAGKKMIIEEKLSGKEVSAFFICDGNTAIPLGFACDYKTLHDGGKGPNTGGMGAYSPVAWLPENFTQLIDEKIVQPLLKELNTQNTPFVGTLFIGLMQTQAGPKVLEFNVRFGDPETQAILPLLDSDLLPVLEAASLRKLHTLHPNAIRFKRLSSVHVVMAASGYPVAGNIRKGDPISIPDELLPTSPEPSQAQKIFFAGVKHNNETLCTSGGRVLGVTALAQDQASACQSTYSLLRSIQFDGAQIRTDIGR